MRINKIKYIVYILLIGILSSCSSNDEVWEEDDSFIKIKGTINKISQNESDDLLWAKNSIIGLYGANQNPLTGEYQNLRYITTDGDGNFLPANMYNDAMFFAESGETMSFISYYPYQKELTNGIYKVDVSKQSSQEAIDLMYSDNGQGKYGDDLLLLDFGHELSKVVFKVEADAPIVSLDEFRVSITNLKIRADYNIINRSLLEEDQLSELTLKTQINGLIAVSEGILLPTLPSERVFRFRVKVGAELKTFDWDASNQKFDPNKKNIYTVKLTDLGNDLSVKIESTIEDWKEGSSEIIVIPPTGGTGTGTELATKIFFAETFGVPVDANNPERFSVDQFLLFDMKKPTNYSAIGTGTEILSVLSRFPDNGYFFTLLQHKGESADDKEFTIDNIDSNNYSELQLSFDYAAGSINMSPDELTLKCDGVTVKLPNEKVANRDRFETVTVALPSNLKQLQFAQKTVTESYMRIDNIQIKGKTKVEK